MPSRFIEIFAVFGLFVLILISQFQNSSTIPIITIGAFIVAAYKIIPGIVKILNNTAQIKTYSFVISDLIKDEIIRKTTNAAKIDSIELVSVSFKYKTRLILDNFSLKINKGDFIGIYGASGKGKTTIINLILGFLSPDKGSIFFNDQQAQAPRAFWKYIAYAKQQSFLIHDSLLKNIVLDENYDKQKLQNAITVSGLNEFITASPDGLDKIIAENGKNISGGQQQRIIIARALYKDADLIILDEPFNELDEESELAIIKELQSMTQKGKIVILITHNKACLSFCTQVVSVDEK
jgi:ABC-type bacteriocin/lantibiotic exporter with double-glycine peptidase domain